MLQRALRSPSVPYVLPFLLFLLLLAVMPRLGFGARLDQVIRIVLTGAALLFVSRPVVDLRMTRPLGSVLLGVGVFVLWVLPDLLWEGYRDGPLFSNSLVGQPLGSFPPDGWNDPVAIGLRFFRAAALVPVIEELFWRAWLPRKIAGHHFERLPLGTYTPVAFWLSAVLFAVEHGSYWDVGLMAGIGYGWWMRTTRSLGDCVLAHAVTNACLSAYVIMAGQWQYW